MVAVKDVRTSMSCFVHDFSQGDGICGARKALYEFLPEIFWTESENGEGRELLAL